MCFLKSARNGHFRNVWVRAGKWSHFSAQSYTLDVAHKHCTALLNQVHSESSSSYALPFSGRAGTPLRQTSPCLCTSPSMHVVKTPAVKPWWGASFDPRSGHGLLYFCGTENHGNHRNRPELKITPIMENHGKSRNWK